MRIDLGALGPASNRSNVRSDGDHENGAGCVFDHLLCDAAEQQVAEPMSPVTSNHDQTGGITSDELMST